jgi:hypothetical protein
MSESLSRRNLLKSLALAAGGAAAAPALVSTAQAQATPAKPAAPAAGAKPAAAAPAGLVKLDPKDPAAVALAYHEDSTKVDVKKYPMHKANQFCNNCLQIQGKAGEAYRPCNLFPKKLVAEKGWCKVWVKKPGTA